MKTQTIGSLPTRWKRSAFGVILMASSMIFLVACKDDEEGMDSNQDIVGTWTYGSSEYTITIGGQNIIDYLIDVFNLTEEEAELAAETFEVDTELVVSSWTFNANKTLVVEYEDGDVDTGTWSLSPDNKKLTVTIDGETDVVDVLLLTKTALELNVMLEEAMDLDEDGTAEIFKIDMTLRLKR